MRNWYELIVVIFSLFLSGMMIAGIMSVGLLPGFRSLRSQDLPKLFSTNGFLNSFVLLDITEFTSESTMLGFGIDSLESLLALFLTKFVTGTLFTETTKD